MLEVVISFLYIGIFCFALGSGLLKLISRFAGLIRIGITGRIVTGIITITTAVGWFSIFGKIGSAIHITLLICAGVSAWYAREDIKEVLGTVKENTGLPEIAVGVCFMLLIAYAASRGDFHTDTGIYHAAAIRLYEEYGIIKGMANVQPHYGYNSSYLGFASFFTLSWILPNALHTTTGFLMILFTLDALYHLRDLCSHEFHYSDALRIALIFYVFMNLTGTMSPATDYAVNLMTGYFMCAWLTVFERESILQSGILKKTEDDSTDASGKTGMSLYTNTYAILSVYGLFLTTMKLSAAMCVTVVILPIFRLIRERRAKHIPGFIGLGLLSFLFYPVRNVILTGWLFYPFEALDLFDLEWKIPVEYSLIDSAQIKVWGRCLFDVNKIDWPVRDWLPVWWEWQEHYDQMMIYAVITGVVMIVLTAIVNRRIRPAVLVFYMMTAANLAVWFFSAPFVRYGLIFLLAVPFAAVAGAMDLFYFLPEKTENKTLIAKYICGALSILICICFSSCIDHYVMDDLVFIKHNLTKPYYVLQQPFDNAKMGVTYLGESGIPIYYTDNDEEKNSYYTPPSTCYFWMLERVCPMGESVKDGFRSR